MLAQIAILAALAATSWAKPAIFTEIDSCTYSDNSTYAEPRPDNPSWDTTLLWTVNGTVHKPDDTITLTMPCVFKTTAASPKFDLRSNGITYARCSFVNGEYHHDASELKCTITDAVNGGHGALGRITIPLTFNAGYGADTNDLKCALKFTLGDNKLVFTEGDAQVVGHVKFDKVEGANLYRKSAPSTGAVVSYYRSKGCRTAGFKRGEIGLISPTPLDCNLVSFGIADTYNDFDLPTLFSGDFEYDVKCANDTVIVKFNSTPSGYNPILTVVEKGGTTKSLVTYIDKFTCADGSNDNGDNYDFDNGFNFTWISSPLSDTNATSVDSEDTHFNLAHDASDTTLTSKFVTVAPALTTEASAITIAPALPNEIDPELENAREPLGVIDDSSNDAGGSDAGLAVLLNGAKAPKVINEDEDDVSAVITLKMDASTLACDADENCQLKTVRPEAVCHGDDCLLATITDHANGAQKTS